MRELKQRRALETRERIIREAARLFALKGYHDTKLEEVVRAAQSTTGACFHHFSSKEDLGLAVIDAHMRERSRKLEQIEGRIPPSNQADPMQELFRRLDAIQVMVRQRDKHGGGCVIGNLSTALSDTHDVFRRRLAQCLDEMALELKPYMDATVKKNSPPRSVDTWELARYCVAVVEGSIMLARTRQDTRMMKQHINQLKDHLKQALLSENAGES